MIHGKSLELSPLGEMLGQQVAYFKSGVLKPCCHAVGESWLAEKHSDRSRQHCGKQQVSDSPDCVPPTAERNFRITMRNSG